MQENGNEEYRLFKPSFLLKSLPNYFKSTNDGKTWVSRCNIGEVSMQSPETRLRRKNSPMPCNLINFIFGEPGIGGLVGTAEGGGKRRQKIKKSKVGKTPAGEEKKCGGRGSVTTTTDSTMSSDVWSAQSLCRRGSPGEGRAQQQGREEESKRAARRMCCPFIGAFAHAQSMSAYVQFLPCVLPV